MASEHPSTSLSLENFDAPGNENSQYILTSPHSLRACARLGLKPMELLPRSFREFEHLSGMPELQLFEIYTDYEAQRRKKLLAAKVERAKLKQMEQTFGRPISVIDPSSKTEHLCTQCKEKRLPESFPASITHPFSEKDQKTLASVHSQLTKKLLQVKHTLKEKEDREHKNQEDIVNATMRRDTLMKRKIEEAKSRLKEERMRFQQSRRNKIERHKLAEERYHLLCSKRECKLKKSAELRLLKLHECKVAARSIEISLERWRNEVDKQCTQDIERAHLKVQQANKEKSVKVHQSRERKKEACNASRVTMDKHYKAQLEEWERKIESWKEKVDSMTKQKTTEIQKSRALAQYTATLRTKLKEYTSENSFAQKSLLAEKRAALESKASHLEMDMR